MEHMESTYWKLRALSQWPCWGSWETIQQVPPPPENSGQRHGDFHGHEVGQMSQFMKRAIKIQPHGINLTHLILAHQQALNINSIIGATYCLYIFWIGNSLHNSFPITDMSVIELLLEHILVTLCWICRSHGVSVVIKWLCMFVLTHHCWLGGKLIFSISSPF